MKSGNVVASLALFLVLVISTSCGGSDANANAANRSAANNNTSNSNSARTNVEELGMLINVPYESDEAYWKEDAAHKKLIAVLRLPQNEANRLISDAEKIRPAQPVTITPESWFPPELEAQSEMTPDNTLTG